MVAYSSGRPVGPDGLPLDNAPAGGLLAGFAPPVSSYSAFGQPLNAAGQSVNIPFAPEAPPPENQAVLNQIASERAAYNANMVSGSGEPSFETANWLPPEGMSGYFDVDNLGRIVPHVFTPSQVAAQAGVTTGQLASGFGPSGDYDNVGYNIPNDRGGFFDVNADNLPTIGAGLSTNNWRLFGRGPGYIMRQGNIINMRDPSTRAGFPAGADIGFSDTDAGGPYRHRYIAPGAALTGHNIFWRGFWPGVENHPGYAPATV